MPVMDSDAGQTLVDLDRVGQSLVLVGDSNRGHVASPPLCLISKKRHTPAPDFEEVLENLHMSSRFD